MRHAARAPDKVDAREGGAAAQAGPSSEQAERGEVLLRARVVDPLVREGAASELDDDVLVGLHDEGAECALGFAPGDHLGEDELTLAGPVAFLSAVVKTVQGRLPMLEGPLEISNRPRSEGGVSRFYCSGCLRCWRVPWKSQTVQGEKAFKRGRFFREMNLRWAGKQEEKSRTVNGTVQCCRGSRGARVSLSQSHGP